MENFSSFFVRTLLCFSLLLFLNNHIQAQSADCDGPGNFELTLPDGTSGTGTTEDPYVVCVGDSIGFSSDGVSPTLGLPNPGLVFIVYYALPQFVDPEEEPFLPNGDPIYTKIAFSTEPFVPIINEGVGSSLSTGLFTGDSISAYIVPIIAPDIDDIDDVDPNCSGIDLSYNYPCITFVNPDAFPNCTLGAPPCQAEAGTLTYETELCVGQSVEGVADGFNEDATFLQPYLLTDTNLDIVAVSGSGDFGPQESGTYILHALNVLAEEVIGLELGDLVGQNAGDVLATLDCYDLESSDDIVVAQVLEFGFNFDEGCSPITNEPIITLTLTSTIGSSNYSMSGDLEATFPAAFFPFDLVTPNGGAINISATDENGCTASITATAPNCEPIDSCDAGAGVLTFAEFYCAGDPVELSAVGANSDLAYTQLFILTDTSLNIIEANGTGTFEVGSGAYLGHALNVLTSEIDGLNPDDLAGLNAGDVLADLECFDLQTSTVINTLNPIEMILDTECFDETGVVSATFAFTGGLPEYAIENGYPQADGFFYNVSGFIEADLSPEDEFFAEAAESQLYELVVTDFLDCILEVTDTLPSCVKECEAEVGLFALDLLEYNIDDEISVTSIDFQEDEEYQQWYLLIDTDFIVLEANMTGEFVLNNLGNFQVYVYNIEGEFTDADFVGGNVIALTFNCFDVSTTGSFNVVDPMNDPIDIGPIEFEVDSTDNTYVATFQVFGGSGMYDATPGTLTTDTTAVPPTTTFTSEEIDCGTNIIVILTDDAGAVFEQEIQAPCAEAVEFACEDYPLEIIFEFVGCEEDPNGELTGASLVTITFTGGLPQYAVDSSSTDPDDYFYTVSGDLNDVFDVSDNSQTITTDSNPIVVTVVDDFGCTVTAEFDIDPPCDPNPVEFSCDDYPIEIDIDYNCDGETGIYTLTYAFTGGLPEYAAENGSGDPDDFFYTVSGDLNGEFDVTDNNHTLTYTDAAPYAIEIVDNFGCEASEGGTPEPCVKTSIQLIEFDGKPIEEGNSITWVTASESYNNNFVLERSYDEVNFIEIAQINGAGNSNVINEYDFLDDKVTELISYYRLIDVEQLGTENISDVITVIREDANPSGFGVIGPIPAKDKIVFAATLNSIKNPHIQITSGIGKLIDGGGRPAIEGMNEIDVSSFPAGLYFLQLMDGDRVIDTVKFIKQ